MHCTLKFHEGPFKGRDVSFAAIDDMLSMEKAFGNPGAEISGRAKVTKTQISLVTASKHFL